MVNLPVFELGSLETPKLKNWYNEDKPLSEWEGINSEPKNYPLGKWENVPCDSHRWSKREFHVTRKGLFASFALEIYESQGSCPILQLGSVEFMDEQGLLLPYLHISCNSEQCCSLGEHYINLQSADQRKWCTSFDYFQGYPKLIFTFSDPVCVATVVLESANDSPERDPGKFSLFSFGRQRIATARNEVFVITAVLAFVAGP